MSDLLEREKNMASSLKTRETWLTMVEVAVAALFMILTLLGNTLVCLAVYKFQSLRKPRNYYIVSLAASDLLITVFATSFSTAACIVGEWRFGDAICQIQGGVIIFCTCFSIINMTLISINRYVKMVRSASMYQKIYTRRNILLSIAACAMLSTALVIPYLYHGFCFHSGKQICYLCNNDKENKVLPIIVYSVLTALTFPVLVFCYYKVFRKVRAHFAQIADSVLHNDSSQSFAEEIKVTKMLFTTLLAFLISWSPVFIIEFVDRIRGEYGLPRQVYLIWTFSGAASSLLNPLIYGFMRKEFRNAYRKLLTCKV